MHSDSLLGTWEGTGSTEESTRAPGYGTGSWYSVVLGAWSRGETLQRALRVIMDDARSTLIDYKGGTKLL